MAVVNLTELSRYCASEIRTDGYRGGATMKAKVRGHAGLGHVFLYPNFQTFSSLESLESRWIRLGES